MTRVPWTSCMPSGSVTRRIFFGSPSGSIRTAATTGMPDSMRASLPVQQTCLALGSLFWPLRQNLVHGEKINWTCCSACPCAGACCCASGAGAAGAAGFAAGFFGGGRAGGVLGGGGGGGGGGCGGGG